MNPSKYIEEFLAEMVELLPNSEYRKRGKCPVKEMCDAAVKRGFTNLLIFTEDNTKKNVGRTTTFITTTTCKPIASRTGVANWRSITRAT